MATGAYNIQNWHKSEEVKKLYTSVRETEGLEQEFKRLPEPVLTRWWLVGACAVQLKETKETWKQVLCRVLTYSKSNSAVNKIASTTLGIMDQPMIVCNHELMCVFHTWFLFLHFAYLQKGNAALGGTPSFLSWHILVRYFLMQEDLNSKR